MIMKTESTLGVGWEGRNHGRRVCSDVSEFGEI